MGSLRSFKYAALLAALGVMMVPTASSAAPTTSTTSAPSRPFTDISCPAAHNCYAVGTNPWPGSGAPFVAHLTHGGWSFAEPPWPTARKLGQLDAIDCYSTSVCIAVGSSNGAKGGHRQDLALKLAHGRWHLTTFAAPAHTADTMKDVSCAGKGRCVAVAERPNADAAIAYSLAAGHWTRTRIVRPTGDPASTRLALSGVSCASKTDCVAVGSDSHTGQPFTATLRAGAWEANPLVVPENGSDTWSYGVARVSCATSSSCVAVGDRENKHGVLAPLVSTLQGSAWTFSTLKRLTAGNGNLADVDCLTTENCFAIGNQGAQVLTEGLHHGSWRGAIHATTASTYWNEVSCRESTCEAVGDHSGTTTKGHHYEDGVARTFAYAG
jgi:hypothetical protein